MAKTNTIGKYSFGFECGYRLFTGIGHGWYDGWQNIFRIRRYKAFRKVTNGVSIFGFMIWREP